MLQKQFMGMLCLFAAVGHEAVLAQAGKPAYVIDVAGCAEKEILDGHLNLGGSNPFGGTIGFNSYYMLRDGKPFIPVTGEFHYFRFPNEYWEQELLKIKAGGVNTITSYVMWNYHEEKEGVFDWSGDKNLRKFVELCKKHGLDVIIRIGPFCHSEMRNGGFPDWLYGREFQIRTDDPVYLKYVDRFYTEIARQVEWLFYKDGGPIVGIQIENELQHSSAPWGIATYPGQPRESTVASYDEELTQVGVSVQKVLTPHAGRGVGHLRTLKRMAEGKGMVAPWYTVTGWGNAAFLDNEAIPVGASYPYPFGAKNPRPSWFYLFKDIQADPDYSPVRYDGNRYPAMTAELGPGGSSIYTQRPRVPALSTEALVVRCLGSGMNGIGYYIYHGGITPKKRDGFYMSEEPMGVPKMSYDWYSPIGEYGIPKDSYRNLRLLNVFINDFDSMLAPMRVVLPEGYDTLAPSNDATLRYAVREKGGSGFVFMTNFQDHSSRQDQRGISIGLMLEGGMLRIPAEGSFTLPAYASAVFPFNISLDGIRLRYATAQLLSKIDDGGVPHYIFFAHNGIEPEYVFDEGQIQTGKLRPGRMAASKDGLVKVRPRAAGLGSTIEVVGRDGRKVYITTLTREQALGYSAIDLDGMRCGMVSQQDVLPADSVVTLLSRGVSEFEMSLLPARDVDFGRARQIEVKKGRNGRFATYSVKVQPCVVPMSNVTSASDRRFGLKLDSTAFDGLNDIVFEIDYIGDMGMVFCDGEMLNDNLCQGEPWMISLKRYKEQLAGKGLYFYLKPLYKDAPFLDDLPRGRIEPLLAQGKYFKLESLRLLPEYKVSFHASR